MDKPILVTGAGGLLGMNICQIALSQGRRVRGLVRAEDDARLLRTLEIEPVLGDVRDAASVRRAVEGAEGVIHTAALLGGTWSKSTPAEFDAVNYHAVLTLLDAVRDFAAGSTVLLATTAIFDPAFTLTERSPLLPIAENDTPYTKSKRACFHEGMRRASRGERLNFVVPGPIYGPSPNLRSALGPTSFTGVLYAALTGKLDKYAAFPFPWVYVDDVARTCLAALDSGTFGARYIAAGRAEDVRSLAAFCNLGCEMAGIAHRVADLSPEELGDGLGVMAQTARRKYMSPLVDGSETAAQLRVPPTPLDVGMKKTLAWLRAEERI